MGEQPGSRGRRTAPRQWVRLRAALWVALTLAIAFPLALARTTFLIAPTADGLWRGLADPPSAAHVAVALAAAALASTLILRRAPLSVASPLLVGLLAAAPFIPVQ